MSQTRSGGPSRSRTSRTAPRRAAASTSRSSAPVLDRTVEQEPQQAEAAAPVTSTRRRGRWSPGRSIGARGRVRPEKTSPEKTSPEKTTPGKSTSTTDAEQTPSAPKTSASRTKGVGRTNPADVTTHSDKASTRRSRRRSRTTEPRTRARRSRSDSDSPRLPRPSALAILRAPRHRLLVVCTAVLATGMLCVLLLNTIISQGAFRQHELELALIHASESEEQLARQVQLAEAPVEVERRARALGMVPAAAPVFLRLSDGAVLGDPVPAAPAPSKVSFAGAPGWQTPKPQPSASPSASPGAQSTGAPAASAQTSASATPSAGSSATGTPVPTPSPSTGTSLRPTPQEATQ